MLNYIDANLDLGYLDARPELKSVPAKVEIDAKGMKLQLELGGVGVLFHGERRGQGHYVLNAPEVKGVATLHRFADSVILEGFWRTDLEQGFWRLHLPHDTVIPLRRPIAKLATMKKKRARAVTPKRARAQAAAA